MKRAVAVIVLVVASVASSVGITASGMFFHLPATHITHQAGLTDPPLPDGSGGSGPY